MPTTVENAFITEDQWDRGGMPWDYKPALPPREVWQRVETVWRDLESMGALTLPTCVPYLHLSIPKIGECHAWIESNAACSRQRKDVVEAAISGKARCTRWS